MKLLISIHIALLCLIAPLFSQNNSNISELFTQNEFSDKSDSDLLFICRISTEETSKVEEWKPAVLIDYKNNTHQVEGHYDIAANEMKILLQNKSRTIFPEKIKAVRVGKMIFIPAKFEGQETLSYGYFQVLSSNKIALLKRFENKNGTVVKSFYTRIKDEEAKLLNLNKKSVLKILDDKRTAKFLKEKQLKIKEEQDLIKLFEFYNSL